MMTNLCNLNLLVYIINGFYLITALPHIPEIVYPQKSFRTNADRHPQYDAIRRIQATTPSQFSSITTTTTTKTYEKVLKHFHKKILADSSTERKRTRVLLAPIDGVEVITAEDYSQYDVVNGVPNVVADKDFDDSEAEQKAKLPKLASLSMKRKLPNEFPQKFYQHNDERSKGGFKGQSFISEIDPNQQRTTMAEMKFSATESPPPSTTTRRLVTLSASTIKSGYIRIKAQPRNVALNGTKNVRANEIDSTSSRISNTIQTLPRPETEKRFPAEKWQLPPSISKSGLNQQQDEKPRLFQSQLNDFDTRGPSYPNNYYPPPRDYHQNSRFGPSPNQGFIPQQPPSPLALLNPETVLTPFQALTAALSSTGQSFLPQSSRPLPSPPYQPVPIITPPRSSSSSNHSHLPYRSSQGAPKYHATFAKHNDVIKPIPLPSTSDFDENDMDLLSPNAHQLPPSADPIPIPLSSAGGIPISPVTTTFGQQRGIPMGFENGAAPKSNLHPNEKLALCCQKQSLSSSCQNLCNFDTFTDKTLVSTFLTNQCPEPQRGLAFQCATTNVDHSECCRRNNLHNYSGGQCMPFCTTHIPTPPNVFSYLQCLQVFDTIKNCYREHQFTNPNIFGD